MRTRANEGRRRGAERKADQIAQTPGTSDCGGSAEVQAKLDEEILEMGLIPKYVAPGQGEVLSPIGSDRTTFKATSQDTGGAYFLMEQLIAPGHGPRPHVHRREEEAFYVVQGQFDFQVGSQHIKAMTGAFVVSPVQYFL